MVRLKHRYLLINILYPLHSVANANTGHDEAGDFVQIHAPSPSSFTEGHVFRMIRDSISEVFGDYGVGKVAGSLKVIYFSTATSTAIIRVSRDHVRMLWAALTFIKQLPNPFGHRCVIHVVRNSGTIRLAEEEAIKRARDFIRRARSSNQPNGIDQILKNAVEREERENGGGAHDDDVMSENE